MADVLSPILFESGLPAFEHCREFQLRLPAADGQLFRLETLDQSVGFSALPAATLDGAYHLQLSEEDRRQLMMDQSPGTPLVCLVLLAVIEGEITANLRAPVVLNLAARRGLQAIRADDLYSHRHPVCRLSGAAPPC